MSEETKIVEPKIEANKKIQTLHGKYFQIVGNQHSESASLLVVAHIIDERLSQIFHELQSLVYAVRK